MIKATNYYWGLIDENEAKESVSTENTFMRERVWTLASSIMNVKCLSRWLSREECADRGEVFTYANRQHQRKSNCIRGNSVYIKKNDDTMNLTKNTVTGIKCRDNVNLTKREGCYFVVWTTKETLILQIKKVPAWADNLRRLQDFNTRHIIPAFITDLL